MKKISAILILIVILMPFSLLLSQPEGPPHRMDMGKELKTKLQLTDEQAVKIETVFSNNEKKIDSLFEKTGDDKEAGRKAMDEIRKSTKSQIEKILTKEQKAKFQKIMEEMENRMPPPPPQGRLDMENRMQQPEPGRQFGMMRNRMQQPGHGNQFGMRNRMQQPGPGGQFEMSEKMDRMPVRSGCRCCEHQRMMPPPPPDDEDIISPEDVMDEFFL
jgi:hypothetical protein